MAVGIQGEASSSASTTHESIEFARFVPMITLYAYEQRMPYIFFVLVAPPLIQLDRELESVIELKFVIRELADRCTAYACWLQVPHHSWEA
jgi:hypothetical protein